MAASARSPYFIPSRKREDRRRRSAMPQAGWRGGAAQSAGKEEPQGRAHRMMPANRRKEIWVSPAKIHRTSSGKKGNRKASTRKISVLAWITSRYFSETFRPTRRVTASRPRPRARRTPAATRWRPRKRLAGRRPRCRRALRKPGRSRCWGWEPG